MDHVRPCMKEIHKKLNEVRMDALKSEIEGGKPSLKHVETEDKAAPVIDPSVHIGKNQHDELLKEVTAEHELKHAETVDKSAPIIEKDVHVGENPRPKIFAEIASRSKE